MPSQTAVKNGITEGVIWKQLLWFFFPILFGTFFQQLYNTVDAVIVGQFVGKEALAAVGGHHQCTHKSGSESLCRYFLWYHRSDFTILWSAPLSYCEKNRTYFHCTGFSWRCYHDGTGGICLSGGTGCYGHSF